jgi:mannose-6-phosphate isomerase-like protein (cupin superfamily)
MARYGDFYENKVTGERGVVLRGDEDSGGQPALVHLTVQPHGAVAGEHMHPRGREAFRVISGRLGTRVDGVERILTAGEGAVAVPGTWHDFWNAGVEEAHVLVELSPLDQATRFEQLIGTMFGLANAGKTNAEGMPNLLQLAMIGREFQDVSQFAKPPRAVQRVMFGLLGPIGRMRGYRGVYPEYCHPHGRTIPDPAVLALAGLAPPEPDDLTRTRP